MFGRQYMLLVPVGLFKFINQYFLEVPHWHWTMVTRVIQ